jgi:hypothetical protein
MVSSSGVQLKEEGEGEKEEERIIQLHLCKSLKIRKRAFR